MNVVEPNNRPEHLSSETTYIQDRSIGIPSDIRPRLDFPSGSFNSLMVLVVPRRDSHVDAQGQ